MTKMTIPERLTWLKTASDREIGNWADIGLRHKSGATANDRLERLLEIVRVLGVYATTDDSWGEFEKRFSGMVVRMVRMDRSLVRLSAHPILGMPLANPRCEYCGEEDMTEGTLYACDEKPCQYKG